MIIRVGLGSLYLQIPAQTECQNAALNPSQTLVGVSLLLLVRSALGVSLSLSAYFFVKSGECFFQRLLIVTR